MWPSLEDDKRIGTLKKNQLKAVINTNEDGMCFINSIELLEQDKINEKSLEEIFDTNEFELECPNSGVFRRFQRLAFEEDDD